eukprot:TRINITY_DN317_c0_g2_i1.p1 TRINITY_DN317_c0_g2~~TRINITY_DN317_c0_g2_i1.p1  ORF type:complete len:460 (-),score=121.89 TRINITY_DN317_c0_g2_i1:800-2065(-)
MSHYRLRIRNASQVVRVCDDGSPVKIGVAMNDVCLLENGTIIVDETGCISDIGSDKEMKEKYVGCTFDADIDADGKSVLPGFVDGHTHPVWSGDRVGEFSMKLEGATYMDVHKAGGGINFTVRHTRESPKEELKELCRARFDRMIRLGTTLVEAKSGYGLDVETEMKMLEVIHEVSQDVPIEVVGTYLAHSVPRGMEEKEAADNVVNEQIPEMIRRKALGKISPELCDVFHEKGVFEGESALRILRAGKEAGLELNFHGDELHPMGSCELGAQLGALAVSHVENITEDGIKAMAEKKCVAVVLPTTFFILRIDPPPVRKMIEADVPLALASDFNPNAHCMSMPFVMLLGCVKCHMTLNEALVAVTINAAASINRSKTHGSIEVGKMGDFVIVDSPRWEHVVYEMTDPPITHIIKSGNIIHR